MCNYKENVFFVFSFIDFHSFPNILHLRDHFVYFFFRIDLLAENKVKLFVQRRLRLDV